MQITIHRLASHEKNLVTEHPYLKVKEELLFSRIFVGEWC